MKLIIDIPEEAYEIIKKDTESEMYIIQVIKQGTPLVDVLDNLRAELHATAEFHDDGDCYLRDEWIDEYFDIYKAESEGME